MAWYMSLPSQVKATMVAGSSEPVAGFRPAQQIRPHRFRRNVTRPRLPDDVARITAIAAVINHRRREVPEALAMAEDTCLLAKPRNRGDGTNTAR